MIKKYRFSFNNAETTIINFLRQQNIGCETTEIVTVFELYETDKNFHIVYDYLCRNNIKASSIDVLYSNKEIEEAEWLSVRSTWRLGYPQPQNDMQYRNTTYDSSRFCEECGYGLVQKENFVLKKEPNWGTRNFFMANWIHDEIFASDRAIQILQNNNISGFSINDVLNPSKQVMKTVKQFYVKNYLNYGLLHNSIKTEFTCPKCNSKKYILNYRFIGYEKKALGNIEYDIVKTKEKFGEITCASLIFITHKLYKIISNHKLDRGLVFTPIRFI